MWLLTVYCPLVFLLWSDNAFLDKFGIIDWAGGLVVHVNAGVSALVLTLVAGKRKDFGEPMQPHNLMLVFIGTAFLLIGWAGFNGGSSFDNIYVGAQAILCSFIAASTGGIVWAFIERFTRGSISLIGVCSGMIAGLVCVTPAAGYITPATSVLFGIMPIPFCIIALKLIKNR